MLGLSVVLLSITLYTLTLNTNVTEAQEVSISDNIGGGDGGNSCFTRFIKRKNQSSLGCAGGGQRLCLWIGGKGKDRAQCGSF